MPTQTAPNPLHELSSFVDRAKESGIEPEDLTRDLANLALVGQLPDGERPKTDRKTRELIRDLAGPALALIREDADGDPALQGALEGDFLTVLTVFGVTKDTLPGFKKTTTLQEQNRTEQIEYLPEVSEDTRQYLETIMDRIRDQRGVWRDKDTQEFASGFLDIYYPAQKELARSRNRNNQASVNAIASCNMYSHSVAEAISALPDNQRTLQDARLRETIIKTMQLRDTNHSSGPIRSETTLQDSDELKEFTSAMRGARLENAAFDAITEAIKNHDDIKHVAFASLEDDIKRGFDLIITDSEGAAYRVDIKSAGNFKDLINKNARTTLVMQNTAVAIKGSPDTDESGQRIPIITINAVEAGYNGRDTNKFQFENPTSFIQAVHMGMQVIKDGN